MSVKEYAQKFNEYAKFCPNMVSDEVSKAQKFEDGLAFRIQTRLGGSTSSTLAEAYSKACNMERILQREEDVLGRNKRKDQSNADSQSNDKRPRFGNNGGNGRNNHHGGGHNNRNYQNPRQNENQQRNGNQRAWVCKKCEKSHSGYTCQGEPIKCYACGEAGHKANYCPKRQKGNQPRQDGHNKGYNNNGGGSRNHNFKNNRSNNTQAGSGPANDKYNANNN